MRNGASYDAAKVGSLLAGMRFSVISKWLVVNMTIEFTRTLKNLVILHILLEKNRGIQTKFMEL